tara:strand:+ start:14581 stop:15651 length:1071 start_codon:yes stop_codon:yes gene_type:complete
MIKVMVIFSHRPNKVSRILPYSKVEYRVIVKQARWKNLSPLLRLLLLVPSTLWTLLLPFNRMRLRKQVRIYKPDIILAHGGTQAFNERIVAKSEDKKFVMRLGGHVYGEMRDNLSYGLWMNRLTYREHYKYILNNIQKADHIIVVTEDMKLKLCHEGNIRPEKVSVVPVSCNVGRFDKPKKAHRGKVILTVINLNFKAKAKAMQEYLSAVTDHIGAECQYRMVMPGRYGRDIPLHPDNLNILASGFVSNIEREYQKADLFCYFSHLDGCPNVILEAWASRTPVIANRCSWSKELIEHGKTGLLANSPAEAKYYIASLFYDPQRAKTLADNGYEYVTTHHTEKVAGERMGEVLRGIV